MPCQLLRENFVEFRFLTIIVKEGYSCLAVILTYKSYRNVNSLVYSANCVLNESATTTHFLKN